MSYTKKSRSSTFVILIGFFSMLILLAINIVVSFYSISSSNNSLNKIVNEQLNIADVYTMQNAAQARAIKLFHMMAVTDAFDQDDIYLLFNSEGDRFLSALNAFLSRDISTESTSTWESILPNIKRGGNVQLETVYLIQDESYEAARKKILLDVIPIQNKVSMGLSELLKIQKASIQNQLVAARQSNNTFYFYILSLGFSVLFLGIFITYYVYQHNTKTENALIEQQKAAETASKAKSNFLANMSHEIRTPLTAIIGFSEQVLNPDLNLDEQQKLQEIIVNNSMHLQRLINDVLDLSKIESGQFDIELTPLSPPQILYDIESIIAKRATDKGLYFKIENIYPLPSGIISDAVRLQQVIMNLCGNAIKFTSQGGITLKTTFNQNENTLSFTVSDTGIGLNEEEQARIFKPFIQADVSTSKEFGGTGLGLSISILLAKEMQGTLTVSSIKGTGSQFTFTIPTGITGEIKMLNSNDEYVSITSNNSSEENIKQLDGYILLAEDTKDNQELISLYVHQTGAQLDIVADGEQAIQRALNKNYDLILMDMQMPIIDGIEATATLRKLGYTGPIVSLSANVLASDKEKILKAGANNFLTKPIKLNEFYNVLNKYLKESSKESNQQDLAENTTSGMVKLKQKFLDDLPSRATHLNTALAEKSWEKIDKTSHYLKGIADTFECRQIGITATKINLKVRKNEYDAIPELIHQLNLEIESATSPENNVIQLSYKQSDANKTS